MGKITPEELVQNVREFIQEDLDFDPPQSRRFYTTNIFQRTLAHIVGWTPWGARMLRCTSAGELKTAPTSTGIESYQAEKGAGADTYQNVTFEQMVSRIDIFVWDNPAQLRLSKDGGLTFFDEFEVPPGFYSVDMRAVLCQIMNKTAGQMARYQVIGWW